MMWFLRAFAMLAILAWVSNISLAEPRTWTSASGKFRVEAEFVKTDGTSVSLRRSNGKVLTVPLSALSKEDQAFIAALKNTGKPAPADGAPDGEGADKAREVLEAKGLKVQSSGFSLPAETELGDGLREIAKSQAAMRKAASQLAVLEKQFAEGLRAITTLTQFNVQLNTQLAAVPPNNVGTYNKLVSAINANRGKIELLEKGREQLQEHIRKSRGLSNEAREAYVEKLLELRKLASSVTGQYTKLAIDQEAREAVAQLNSATGKNFQLAPSRDFLRSEKRLQALEETVLSETIPLRRDRGDSLWVSVVINGKHTKEMIVDSGSTMMALPLALAKECGIEVNSEDPIIILVLANGDRIEAREKILENVRVGKFAVENVRCAVYGADATEAEPLLGLSYLGEFKFEIDPENAKLSMVRVEAEANRGQR